MKIFTSILLTSLGLILSFTQVNAASGSIGAKALQKLANTETRSAFEISELQLGKVIQHTIDTNKSATTGKFRTSNSRLQTMNVQIRSYGSHTVGVLSYLKKGPLKGTEILLVMQAPSINKLQDTTAYKCYTNVDRILSNETGQASHNTESVYLSNCKYVYNVHSVIHSHHYFR